MSVRAIVWDVLDTDSTFKAMVPQLWVASASAGVDGKEPIPDITLGKFGFLIWGYHNPALAHATQRFASLRVYDRPGSMLGIEDALLRARITLEAAPPVTDASGTVFAIQWTGDTDDFFDPDYNAVSRSSSFLITSTGER